MRIAISVSEKEKAKGSESPYIKALLTAGASPDEIQMVAADGKRRVSSADFDGILFTGGEDVDPELYGEKIKYDNVKVNRARDDFEIVLLDGGIKSRLPILGICRGIQVVNVRFGGTLYQDLKNDRPLGCDHKQQGNRSAPAHSVIVTEPDSLLHGIFTGMCRVNSLHHQAINRLGRGLKVTAHSEDELDEAIELAGDYPFFLAVQWHPEEMFGDHPEQRKLFERFVARCRERAGERTSSR